MTNEEAREEHDRRLDEIMDQYRKDLKAADAKQDKALEELEVWFSEIQRLQERRVGGGTMIYFTADLHFGHANIIKFCQRPFDHVQQMNEILIRNWNSVVKPTDTVYVPGDFAMGDPRPYLERLYGDIYLIPGDHDKWNKWPKDNVLPKIYQRSYRDQLIVLCHYPILAWPRSHYGSWHIHGHCHEGTLPFCPGKIMNVGVDLECFRPVSWPEVVEYMKGQPDNWNLARR